MQELIEYIESNEIVYNKDLILKLKELMEKEKQQMKDIFEHCWNHTNWNGEYDIKDMEDYLKNYNKNK